jgi:LysM repeat protein
MNRRQLLFLVLANALVSLVIAVAVVWIAESRRPDLEELAALYTPPPPVVLIPTSTPEPIQAAPSTPVAPLSTPEPAQSEPNVYVVQPGDNLLAIAVRFDLTLDELMEANNITDPDFVFAGQRLVIPSAAGNIAANSPGQSAATQANVSVKIIGVDNPGDLDGEQVILANDSDAAVNLQGWSLIRDGGPVYTFGDLPLFPGASVRIHSTGGADTSVDLYWGQPEPLWPSGTTVRLLDASGAEVTTYTVP